MTNTYKSRDWGEGGANKIYFLIFIFLLIRRFDSFQHGLCHAIVKKMHHAIAVFVT